ncbi:MAG: tail fiber domain-containing protein, partial [Patescibacteria group bacterium]
TGGSRSTALALFYGNQSTGFSEGMRITGSGLVGIGTTTPAARLHVYGNGTTAAAFTNGNVGIGTTNPGYKLDLSVGNIDGIRVVSSNSPSIRLDAADGYNWAIATKYSVANAFEILYNSGGAPSANKFTILSTGNVGIGTTNPGTHKLYVAGDIWADTNIVASNGDITVGTDGKKLYTNYIANNSGTLLHIQDNGNATTFGGNVGIGTTSPLGKLHVNGVINAGTESNTIDISSWASLNANYELAGPIGYWGLRTGTNHNINFDVYNGGTQKAALTILQNGNVGINKAAPDKTLDVVGSINASGNVIGTGLCIGSDCKTAWSQVGGASGWTTDSSTKTTTTYNVGIGTTTPSGKLQVADTGASLTFSGDNLSLKYTSAVHFPYIEWRNSAGTRGGYMGWGLPGSYLELTLENSNNFAILGGNVGIGTTTPMSDAAWASPGLDISGTRGTAVLRTTSASGAATLRMTGPGASYVDDWHINMVAGATSRIDFNPKAGGISPAGLHLINDGKVGIGTTAPGQGKLWIQDGNIWVTGNQMLAFSTDGSTDETPNVAIRANGNNTFFSNWSGSVYLDRMTILGANGNIGIGTTNPTAKLHIYGGSHPSLKLENASAHSIFDIITTGSYEEGIRFFHGTARQAEIYTLNGDKILRFNNDSGDILAINAANVGIGTTSPVGKLQVYGTAGTSLIVGPQDIGTSAGSTYNKIALVNTGNDSFLNIGQGTNNNLELNWTYNATAANAYAKIGTYGGNNPLILQPSGGNVGIGTTTPSTKLEVGGDVTAVAYYYSSDRNLKTNIKTLNSALEKVTKLRGVSFDWKNSGEPSLGLIAQEVQQVYPELVGGTPGNLTIQYGNLVAPLIEAVKEQQKQIDNQEKEINRLEVKVKVLESKKK